MTVRHLLAVVAVSDLDVARPWYSALVGRAPTNSPMATLVEWRVTDTGWLQVFVDTERAGRSFVNLAVDDLGAHREALRGRGLEPGPVVAADRGVELSSLTDPDGNVVTLIGHFRVEY